MIAVIEQRFITTSSYSARETCTYTYACAIQRTRSVWDTSTLGIAVHTYVSVTLPNGFPGIRVVPNNLSYWAEQRGTVSRTINCSGRKQGWRSEFTQQNTAQASDTEQYLICHAVKVPPYFVFLNATYQYFVSTL